MTSDECGEWDFWRRGHGSADGFPEPDEWEVDRMMDREEAWALGWRRDEL